MNRLSVLERIDKASILAALANPQNLVVLKTDRGYFYLFIASLETVDYVKDVFKFNGEGFLVEKPIGEVKSNSHMVSGTLRCTAEPFNMHSGSDIPVWGSLNWSMK